MFEGEVEAAGFEPAAAAVRERLRDIGRSKKNPVHFASLSSALRLTGEHQVPKVLFLRSGD
jgi:hypothetical protein